eukprot:4256667-Amphidinium_carterae.3
MTMPAMAIDWDPRRVSRHGNSELLSALLALHLWREHWTNGSLDLCGNNLAALHAIKSLEARGALESFGSLLTEHAVAETRLLYYLVHKVCKYWRGGSNGSVFHLHSKAPPTSCRRHCNSSGGSGCAGSPQEL